MKKKKMRLKFFASVLSLALVVTSSFPVYAKEENGTIETSSVVMKATGKIKFASEKDMEYATLRVNGTLKRANRKELDAMIEAVTMASGSEKKKLAGTLAEYGIYLYDAEDENVVAQPRSNSGDVSVSIPNIFYESETRNWVVTCSGRWLNDNWKENAATPGNVGGKDAFGVSYTSTEGTYSSSVVRASAYISDDGYGQMSTTSNRSDGNGEKGFGFQLQDRIYNGSTTMKYVGDIWYGTCSYDSNFGLYSGVATAYYFHTYNQTYISGISFGVNGTVAGVQVNFSTGSGYFSAYSNDRRFS